MPNNDIIQFPKPRNYSYNFGTSALAETEFIPKLTTVKGGIGTRIANKAINKARNYPYAEKISRSLTPEHFIDSFVGAPISQYIAIFDATKTNPVLSNLKLNRILNYGSRTNLAIFLGVTFGYYVGRAGWKVIKQVFFDGSDGDVALKDVEEAQEECENFQYALDEAYEGLEDLKLGPISMTYQNTGFCAGSGMIGRTGDDFQREIARVDIQGKFSHFSVIAYSYRGYRFTDPDQGGGIDSAMDFAFGTL